MKTPQNLVLINSLGSKLETAITCDLVEIEKFFKEKLKLFLQFPFYREFSFTISTAQLSSKLISLNNPSLNDDNFCIEVTTSNIREALKEDTFYIKWLYLNYDGLIYRSMDYLDIKNINQINKLLVSN